MNLDNLHIDHEHLADICRRYLVAHLEAFGSFTRGDAGPDSDLDILVTFVPDAKLGLRFIELQQELESLFGRSVDLLTRSAVERSPNKYFKRFALRNTESIFEPA